VVTLMGAPDNAKYVEFVSIFPLSSTIWLYSS